MSLSKKKQAELRQEHEWERIDEAVVKSENFLEKNQKQLLIGIGVVVLVVCGYLGYKQFVAEPKAKEAQVALFRSEMYFRNGQDSLALFGDGKGSIGLESVISEYGSTKPGVLAKLYAGISYANMGENEKALNYLKGYSGSDLILSHLVNGAIGDCLVNTGKAEDAISYFIKAAKGVDNDSQSPILYKKAGMIYRDLNQHDKVIETFSIIKDQYANSPLAADAHKYIEEAKILRESK